MLIYITGQELEEYIARLGWKSDLSTGVVEVPPNPDNQIASTVVQEDIKLQRMSWLVFTRPPCSLLASELTKVISHAVSAV
jgi:hypothetical protein